MTPLVLLVAFILSGPPAPSPIPPHPEPSPSVRPLSSALYAFSLGGQLGDAASTLHFRTVGIEEMNPRVRGLVYNHPRAFVTVKAGIGLFGAALGDFTYRLGQRRRGQPGAKACRIVGRLVPLFVGFHGFERTVHNERLIGDECRRRGKP